MIATTKKKSTKKAAAKRIPKRSQGEDGRHLGPGEPLRQRRRLGEGVHMPGKRRSAATAKFEGTLGQGAARLAECIKFHLKMDRDGERLGVYAFLRTTEDQANSTYQRMVGTAAKRRQAAPGRAASFFQPELMAIAAAKMKRMLADRKLAPYRLMLDQLLRLQAPHAQRQGRNG